MKSERRGLSIIEASFVLAAVAAGILMMQIYLKRAVQGRLRAVSDGLSETRYSPGAADSYTETRISLNTSETDGFGWSVSESLETRLHGGSETVYVR